AVAKDVRRVVVQREDAVIPVRREMREFGVEARPEGETADPSAATKDRDPESVIAQRLPRETVRDGPKRVDKGVEYALLPPDEIEAFLRGADIIPLPGLRTSGDALP